MKIYISCVFIALSSLCVAQQNTSNTVADGKIFTSIYQQKAAEYKALCFQAYNIAQLRLSQATQKKSTKKRCVITDIDETVLDNSPSSVHQALQGKDYEPTAWKEWTSLAKADTLAGALTFFNYAKSKGVEVFYITNRDEKERTSTLKNLKQYGFPYADSTHLILKQTTSSKEDRRKAVAEKYDIVLLLGDNLGDFSALFDKKTMDERTKNVQQNATEFGKRFIVLPNPNYGDWENSLYQYNYKLTPTQKDSVIKSNLKSY
jgi:5'-nucleotidase (lipoprotein e(P4) family)